MLTTKHKLQLLKDLLQSQHDEQHLTAQEVEQMRRLICNLISDSTIPPNIQQIITTIAKEHTENNVSFNQAECKQWIDMISRECFDEYINYSPGNLQ